MRYQGFLVRHNGRFRYNGRRYSGRILYWVRDSSNKGDTAGAKGKSDCSFSTYRALTCFRQFLSPFRPPLLHSICLFVFPLKWKERKIPCCLAGHGQKGVRGGL